MLSPVQLTQDLVRFETINPPGNERACAHHVGRLLEQAGYTVEYHEFAEARTSLIARLVGRGGRPSLCFTGHLDTVPLGAAPWTRDPLAGEIADGKLWGRGSSDMKAGVAAFVIAALAVAARGCLERGLVLVITAGEETGCVGAADLAARGDALGEAGAVVVAEPTSNYPCIGHKGALRLEAVTRGVTAHGSMPEHGENAIYTMARAVHALEAFEFAVEPHPVLGRPTLNVGTIQGGLNVNSVPDACTIGIDIRTIPGQEEGPTIAALAAAVGPEVELEPTRWVTGVWTEPSHPWIQHVYDVTARVTGARPAPRTLPYFTDGSILAHAYGGVPTVILGPGDAELAHQTNEYCVVERIEQAAGIFERIADQWCRG
jgi:succinyl-diaminopimelate desuccinylase